MTADPHEKRDDMQTTTGEPLTELPPTATASAHALALALADVAGDEAAVLAILADLGRTRGEADALSLCALTLAYTYGRCIVGVLPPEGTDA